MDGWRDYLGGDAMPSGVRPWIWASGILATLAMMAGAYYLHALALAGTGYMSKILCSAVFVSKRAPEAVLAEDLQVDGYESMALFSHKIDLQSASVTSSLIGLVSQRAIYREGLGCTRVVDKPVSKLNMQRLAAKRGYSRTTPVVPGGNRISDDLMPVGADTSALAQAMEAAFAETDADLLQRTRALVVLYRGRVLAERYAEGFSPETALLGWSVSKSALNALVGIRVRQDKLAIDQKKLLPDWDAPGDPRSQITLDHLMRMTSGLEFDEDYDNVLSDVVRMLFVSGDAAGLAAANAAIHRAGAVWSYSSGSSNIISLILRRTFDDQRRYLAFPRDALFAPLGMHSAVLEPDISGTFTASSFMYATARDWARLGLLFLHDGVWEGERILPEGWVEASKRPTQGSVNDEFGAHLWLKLPSADEGGEPPLPDDAFYMLGHDGQIVAVIPSLDLVIVRLGLSRKPGAWQPARILAPIVRAISPP